MFGSLWPKAVIAVLLVGCAAAARAQVPANNVSAAAATAQGALPSADDVFMLQMRIGPRLALIRSRDEFDAYMRAHPGNDNPFRLLSPGGQRRFAEALDFDIIRRAGVPYLADIEAELTLSQAWRLLSLLGAEHALSSGWMPDIRVVDDDDRLVEQWRSLLDRSQ